MPYGTHCPTSNNDVAPSFPLFRSAAQFLDPFKFVVYTEMIGKEHKPVPGLPLSQHTEKNTMSHTIL